MYVENPNAQETACRYEISVDLSKVPNGQIVELVLPDQEEPTLFEVVRSGRTLPDGDVCVYLAQV